jgi:hypothetical protein
VRRIREHRIGDLPDRGGIVVPRLVNKRGVHADGNDLRSFFLEARSGFVDLDHRRQGIRDW